MSVELPTPSPCDATQSAKGLRRLLSFGAAALTIAWLPGCEGKSKPATFDVATSSPMSHESEPASPAAPTSATTGASGHTAAPQLRPTPTPKEYMKFHSAEAEELRRAVIAGKYRDAQPLARTLTENRWTPHLAPTWQQYMTPVYTAAKGYVTATSTAQAARAIGRLGAACAACHAALRGPSLPEPSARPSDAPMAGHAWAVERLWQGLVTPSGEAWSLGAEELSKNPPLRSDIEAIDRAAAKLQALGKQAASTADSERAGAFAEVLTTCAGCHRLVGHAP